MAGEFLVKMLLSNIIFKSLRSFFGWSPLKILWNIFLTWFSWKRVSRAVSGLGNTWVLGLGESCSASASDLVRGGLFRDPFSCFFMVTAEKKDSK